MLLGSGLARLRAGAGLARPGIRALGDAAGRAPPPVQALASAPSKRRAFLKYARWKAGPRGAGLDGRHVAALLPFCDTTQEMHDVLTRELTVRVARAGDPVAFAAPYKELILALLSECNEAKAKEVCNGAQARLHTMFDETSDPSRANAELESALTFTSPSTLERLRTERLARWVGGEGYRSRAHADHFFSTLQDHGVATAQQFEIMLALCTTSAEMRERIGEFADKSTSRLNASAYSILVERMMLEGDRSGAMDIVDAMAEEGMDDKMTGELLQRSSEDWDAVRTQALRERSWQLASRRGTHFARSRNSTNNSRSDDAVTGIRVGAGGVADVKGSGGTIEAQQRLRALFDAMLSNNVATSEHLAEVVRACANSEEMRDNTDLHESGRQQ